jgi:hypothetical protein
MHTPTPKPHPAAVAATPSHTASSWYGVFGCTGRVSSRGAWYRLMVVAVRSSTVGEPCSTPPVWATLQRELLRKITDACVEFFEHYFDPQTG